MIVIYFYKFIIWFFWEYQSAYCNDKFSIIYGREIQITSMLKMIFKK